MSQLNKGNPCAWQIHYHIVMPVKYRKVLLDSRVEGVIKEVVVGISQRYEIEVEAFGSDGGHIHLLCGGHPKMAPWKIVQIFKSITAREIFKKESWVKKELWGG